MVSSQTNEQTDGQSNNRDTFGVFVDMCLCVCANMCEWNDSENEKSE